MLMSWRAFRWGYAVAASGTRATAPPCVKIAIELIGDEIVSTLSSSTVVTASSRGPSLCDRQ